MPGISRRRGAPRELDTSVTTSSRLKREKAKDLYIDEDKRLACVSTIRWKGGTRATRASRFFSAVPMPNSGPIS